jgi:excisionase family DNA binding protein
MTYLLTPVEVASELRISRRSIYRLFERGELRWVQVGARRLVTRDEISRFLAANTRGSVSR